MSDPLMSNAEPIPILAVPRQSREGQHRQTGHPKAQPSAGVAARRDGRGQGRWESWDGLRGSSLTVEFSVR
jgi:hypothetical protein